MMCFVQTELQTESTLKITTNIHSFHPPLNVFQPQRAELNQSPPSEPVRFRVYRGGSVLIWVYGGPEQAEQAEQAEQD